MAKPLSPMNSSITNDSLSLSTKGMTTEAEIDAPVGEHDSSDLFDNLTVGLIVGVAILLICVLPSVMVLVFICHRRQKRLGTILTYKSGFSVESVTHTSARGVTSNCNYSCKVPQSVEGFGHVLQCYS